MQQTSILLTGVTGFVGSTLAAVMLRHGYRILALSRNDPDGLRTKAKIKESYQGFFPGDSNEMLENLLQHVEVLPYDLEVIRSNTRHLANLKRVDIVWHGAAEMSFSLGKAVSTFNGNVGMANGLYQLITEFSPNCRRFFFVSTAYTSGNSRQIHREVLHFQPEHVNPYQMSKWAAEMSLAMARTVHGLPLTIFRPSVVVGHSQNGFYNGQSFGIYAYAHLYEKLQQLGIRKVHLDAKSDTTLDVVPIDQVAAHAMALTTMALSDAVSRLEPMDIVHATGTPVKSSELAMALERVYGVQSVLDSKPRSTIDHSLDQVLSIYKRFNSDNIRFDKSRMLSLVPAPDACKAVDVDRLCLYFQNTSVPDSRLLKSMQLLVRSVNRLSKPFDNVKQMERINRSLGNRLKFFFI
ncbi:SDR family oxidoreductase [Oligoflexus tunisiensis]|uniref:SDR family oxidoreductase n=1 Tax=Oligoflexus tunisiensis TaxID=708132 RepID=UPI00114CCC94|nr:SDR family oxidoreductase [Oligoflexus tunisiensis]